MFLFLLTGCSKESPTEPVASSPFPPGKTYVAPPPRGKLPWPHHDPEFTQAQYQEMMNVLFVINNFGQYQGGTSKQSVYFHDGLDVVVPNGTKVYAVQAGYVKNVWGYSEYYMTIIIADAPDTASRKAWAYTHVNNFQVKVGDYGPQGTHIAEVHFQGLPHVHLNRGYLAGASWTNWEDLNFVQPDTFFVYEDEEPPVIEKPFYYFRNQSDSLLSHENQPVLSGDIDIVVGLREQGAYARARDATWLPVGFGDRLCVSRVELEISSESGAVVLRRFFDFSKIALNYRPGGYERVYSVYKFRYTIDPNPPASWSQIFSYYNLTNAAEGGVVGEIKASDRANSWDTAAKDAGGNRRFPNGWYTITVTASDVAGNSASEKDVIEIRNE